MNLQLENKTALVSASSQGIGFAIAGRLKREGATVVINIKLSARCAPERVYLQGVDSPGDGSS